MRRPLWAIGLILGAILLVYSNSLRNGFVWDDHIYIERNSFVQDPANLKLLFDARYYRGKHEVLMGSRPVVLATFLVDRAVWGVHPAGYHATNLAIHATNSVLVYALAGALGLPPPLSFWAGMFFGLHPIQTEAVNGVTFRTDLLAAFFLLSALWVYLWGRGRTLRLTVASIAASAALFGLGLLSKEMAASLPLLVLLAEAYFPVPEGRHRRLGLAIAAYLAVACAFAGFWSARFNYQAIPSDSLLRSLVDRLAYAMPTAPAAGELPLRFEKAHVAAPSSWEYREAFSDRPTAVRSMIKAFAGYFRLLLIPSPLTVDRAPIIVTSWGRENVLLGLAGIILIVLFAFYFRRSRPAAAFGAAWCLAALIPVSNIIPLYNPVAERYLYLVTAGAALAFASVIAGVRAKRAALLAGCLVAGLYGLRTYARNADWKDDRALFLNAPAHAPQSARSGLIRAGLLLEDGRIAEATSEYEAVVRRSPDLSDGWLGLAAAYEQSGKGVQAAPCYERAIAISPQNPAFPFFYAVFLNRADRREQALTMYRRALKIEPGFVEAWVNLGALHRDAGRFKAARDCFETALKVAPPGNPMPSYSYGLLLEKMGDSRGAADRFHAALKENPAFEPARQRLK